MSFNDKRTPPSLDRPIDIAKFGIPAGALPTNPQAHEVLGFLCRQGQASVTTSQSSIIRVTEASQVVVQPVGPPTIHVKTDWGGIPLEEANRRHRELVDLMQNILVPAKPPEQIPYRRPTSTEPHDPLVSAWIHWIRVMLRELTSEQRGLQQRLHSAHGPKAEVSQLMHRAHVRGFQITWLHQEWRRLLGREVCHRLDGFNWHTRDLQQALMRVRARERPQKVAP